MYTATEVQMVWKPMGQKEVSLLVGCPLISAIERVLDGVGKGVPFKKGFRGGSYYLHT